MISLLHLDEDARVLEETRKQLERSRTFEVWPVTSPREALELLKQQGFDAVISGYRMGKSDGLGFLRKIRSEGNDIPFIVFTAQGRGGVVIEALNSGADYYFLKRSESESEFARLRKIIEQVVHRSRAERELVQNHRLLDNIFRASPNIIYIFDIPGHRNVYSNQEISHHLGYTPEELQQMGHQIIASIVHPDDQERLRGFHDRCSRLGEKEFAEVEYRVRDKTGAWHWLLSRGVPFLRAPDGTVSQYLGIAIDITDQKNVENALKQASAYNRSLIEASLDPLVTIDTGGRIRDVNKATIGITGFSREELIGTDFSEYFMDPGRARAGYEQAFREGSVTDYELWIRHRDGHTTPVIYNAGVYRDEAGTVAGVFAAARDVTRQKEDELAIRQANAYNRSLIEASLDPLVTIGAGGKILDVNEATVSITGFSREELIGTDFSEYSTDPGRARAGYEQAFREGSVKDYELQIRHRDGHDTPVVYNAAVYRDESGSVAGVFAAARDVTRQKRAELAIRQANAYNRSLIEASLDPLVTIGAGGKILDVNEATVSITGFSREELIGTDFSEYFTDPGRARAGYEQAFRECSVTDYELWIRHRDGHTTPVIYNAGVYRDESGSVAGVFAAARDVTRQKEDELAIRQANAYNRSLIEASLDPMVTIGAGGKILDVNEATVSITGFLREELIGTDFSEYFTDPGRARAGYEQAFREGSVKDYELQIRHRDGHDTPVVYNAAVYRDESGFVAGVFAAARDITKRKRAEAAITTISNNMQAIIDNAPVMIWHKDTRNTFVSVNPAFAKFHGRTAGEVTGRSAHDIYPVDLAEQYYHDDLKVIETGIPSIGIIEQRSPALGEKRWVRTDKVPLHGENGEITGVLALAIDITEQKQAEDVLRKFNEELERRITERTGELARLNRALTSEIAQRSSAEETARQTLSLLNAALESTADGILIVDPSGKVTGYNRKYAAMWNMPENTLKSRTHAEIVKYVAKQVKNPEYYRRSVRELMVHLDRESYDMLELVDGRIFERYSQPQKIGHAIVGRVWSFRDITDRKRAEEQIVAALDEKVVLLREVHHRVKNNLQLISSLLDLTRMRTVDAVTEGILTDVMMKIQAMAQIHTRLYESKQFDRVDIAGQIREQVAALEKIYYRKDRDIRSTVKSHEIYLAVDQAIPCALVVNEILSNAFKHGFTGRTKGRIQVSAMQENGFLRITVCDDGIGLPQGFDLNRITSLGIKLSRTLVEQQLKGSLSMKSASGTEVMIAFPILTQEDEHGKYSHS